MYEQVPMEKAGATDGADVLPEKVQPSKYKIMTRSGVQNNGVGRRGQPIKLLTNHFKVSVKAQDAVFYQYTVCSCDTLFVICILDLSFTL